MKYDLVTIGDAFEDVFVGPKINVKFDRSFASGKGIAFEFGEKVPLDWVEYEIGGSACNIAVGLSRQGKKTAIATALGDDTPRQKILETLKKEKVDNSLILLSKLVKTGFSVIFSIEGERTIFVYHGIKDYSVLKIDDSVESSWFFVTSLGENSDQIENRVVEEVSEKGAHLAWNPGSLQIARGANHYRHLLKNCDVLFLNKEEAIKFLGYPIRPRTEEAIKKLHLLGPKIVVITNGREGAKAYAGGEIYESGTHDRIHRVDSTGAGDAFASGFLGKVFDVNFREAVDGAVLKEALAWGIKNSESVIGYIGAQKGLLAKKYLELK
jgi:sugar/nucleoside kinase (ribokinase family)